MQVIQITTLSGHSPYDITICDITKTYCYSGATGVTTAPLTIDIPTELSGSQEVLVIVTDNIGCEEIQYHFCGEPIPSQTPTTTPTPTPTNSVCNCISIDNPLGITLNFGYTQCDGTLFNGEIYSATTLYVCGQFPYGDSGLIIEISSDICVGDVCPGPTPTPTTTPTPTPTLPPIVGYFEDSCNSSNRFTLSNIPISFSPLSGAYYIESSGFIGCATYVVSSSTNNFYTFIAMGSQPSVYHCQKANFIYPCPTLTPTPSITPTVTPTPTVTMTVTPTNTITPTPTSPVKFGLFQVQSCCSKKITKFIMLPSNFLPGTAVVNSYGECLEIINLSKGETWVTDFWDYGTTYIFCEQCVKIQTCDPIPLTPTATETPTNTPTVTQTPTMTQTPTSTTLICSGSVVPPATINGITITDSSTGSVSIYGPSYTSCGSVTTPPNSIYLGQGGVFTYTMNFSVPINNLIVFITGAGQPNNENFIFTTNTGSGIPTITSSISCFSTIVGNQIFSGLDADPDGGGGGKFVITNNVNFTSVTISGDGGDNGALLSVCVNSI